VIVFIDDDKSIIKLFKSFFTEFIKEEAVFFLDPVEALTYIKENVDKITCISTDKLMPAVSGLDLIRVARLVGYKKKIFMLTGFEDVSDSSDIAQLEAQLHIEVEKRTEIMEKPQPVDAYLERVSDASKK
jgi:FixJ family two-component response regulator